MSWQQRHRVDDWQKWLFRHGDTDWACKAICSPGLTRQVSRLVFQDQPKPPPPHINECSYRTGIEKKDNTRKHKSSAYLQRFFGTGAAGLAVSETRHKKTPGRFAFYTSSSGWKSRRKECSLKIPINSRGKRINLLTVNPQLSRQFLKQSGKSLANTPRVLFGLTRRLTTHSSHTRSVLICESKPAFSTRMPFNIVGLGRLPWSLSVSGLRTSIWKTHSLYIFAFLEKGIRRDVHLNESNKTLRTSGTFGLHLLFLKIDVSFPLKILAIRLNLANLLISGGVSLQFFKTLPQLLGFSPLSWIANIFTHSALPSCFAESFRL